MANRETSGMRDDNLSKRLFRAIPDAARELWDILDQEGETVVVGGCVRDVTMGQTPHDWDFATRLAPNQVRTVAEAYGWSVRDTGVQFGGVTCIRGPWRYEVTTFRKDGRYKDGRHPQAVQFTTSLFEDLARRDFTMNAIAVRGNGSVFDPYLGRMDIANHIIRAVGDPVKRLMEDPLRIWRAFRFMGMGSEWDHEVTLSKAIVATRPLLINIPRERQSVELMKLLEMPAFDHALKDLFLQSRVLDILIPELTGTHDFNQYNPHHKYSVAQHLYLTAQAGPTPILRLAGLLHDIAKPQCFTLDAQGVGHFYDHAEVGAVYVQEILKRLSFSNQVVNAVTDLVRHHMFPWGEARSNTVRRQVREWGLDHVRDLWTLREMDLAGTGFDANFDRATLEGIVEEMNAEERLHLLALAISGHDIMRVKGIGPGPEVGAYLRRVQRYVDDYPSENRMGHLIALLEAGTFDIG